MKLTKRLKKPKIYLSSVSFVLFVVILVPMIIGFILGLNAQPREKYYEISRGPNFIEFMNVENRVTRIETWAWGKTNE